jgi:phosphatidylglycerophosphate synthase
MNRRSPPALRLLPHGLTALRLALAPLLFVAIVQGRGDAAMACLVLAMASDAADGPLARRLGVASRAGAWFDVWTDFAVIEAAFVGFAVAGAGPWGLAVLTALSFALFAGTARMTDAIYDPVGRYIGGILMVAAFAVVALRDLYFAEAAYLAAYGALFMTMAARAGFAARLLARQIRLTAP